MGLSPLKPSGVIPTLKYDLFLYDIHNPECCRPKRKSTQKQLETLAANRLKVKIKRDYREWYREVGFIEKDRVRAVKWAREQLVQNDWVILDTETTGLYGAEIVEIAIIDCTEKTLLDTLIKPSIPIPAEVTEIHGITDEMVATAPIFPEIYPRIAETFLEFAVNLRSCVGRVDAEKLAQRSSVAAWVLSCWSECVLCHLNSPHCFPNH